MTLRDRVVVITGGRRIGQVVARELAGLGADIVLSYLIQGIEWVVRKIFS